MRIFVASSCLCVLLSAVNIASAAPSAVRTVQYANELSQVTHDLSIMAGRYGYPNSKQILRRIRFLSDEIEIAARTNDLPRAEKSMRNAIFLVIDLRSRLRYAPYPHAVRIIKRSLMPALNDLGQELFEAAFIPVIAQRTDGRITTRNQRIDASFDALSSDKVESLKANSTSFEDVISTNNGGGFRSIDNIGGTGFRP